MVAGSSRQVHRARGRARRLPVVEALRVPCAPPERSTSSPRGHPMPLKRAVPLVLVLALLLPGCVYGNFGHPLDTNLDDTVLGSKVGESSMQSVLWLVAWGDAGVAAAARQGGITTIRHMDQRTLYVLWGLYYKNTTVVYGD